MVLIRTANEGLFRPSIVISTFVGWSKAAQPKPKIQPAATTSAAGTGLSSARSVRGPAAEAEAASAADQQQPDAVLEDPIENMSSTPSDSIDLPVFLRLRLFLLRKVHDICWELLIGYILHGICLSFKAPTVLLRKGHEVCWGFWIFCVVVYYISYFWDFGYILYGSCLSF